MQEIKVLIKEEAINPILTKLEEKLYEIKRI